MKRQVWREAEQDKLLALRDEQGLDWPAVAAALPGRTEGACKIQYYARLRDRAQAKRYSANRLLPPRPAPVPVIVTAPPVAPQCIMVEMAVPRRSASLDVLRTDADLRARIAERGLTGGVFNDPPPGRSALDERTRAAAAAAQRPSEQGGSDVG
jgi:hypothetical protein